MKIEQINENQIKCTLTRADLASRQIRLSELAYGTEKTRDLFEDMMDQAFTEFGFEASDPLMIEAIPVSMDCIVLMITRVDEPDSVDQEFAGLSNITEFIMPDMDEREAELEDLLDSLADDRFLEDGILPAHAAPSVPECTPETKPGNLKAPLEMIYSFRDFETCIDFAHKADPSFTGKSSLYRESETGTYFMILVNCTKQTAAFGAVCSLALEYGSKEPTGFARSAYIEEHFEKIIPAKALQKLALV